MKNADSTFLYDRSFLSFLQLTIKRSTVNIFVHPTGYSVGFEEWTASLNTVTKIHLGPNINQYLT